MNKTIKLLEVSQVTKRFNTQLLFKKLDFVIEQHEWVGIEGENGTGKTTLINMIMGFEEYEAGAIYFQGSPVTDFPEKRRYQEMQLVTQYTRRALDPTKTIKQILVEPLKRFNLVEKKEHLNQVNQMLTACHLPLDILTKRPTKISGGQYQRVCLALALLVRPKLLICDEATANLDKINELRMIKLLKRQKNMSVIFISHNKNLVTTTCDRTVDLADYR